MSYPRGLFVALVVMCVTYLLPLVTATALDPAGCPWQRWQDGSFSALFLQLPGVGPWLAYFLMAGAAVSCLGQFVTEMVVDSYQLHGMAEQGLMPAVFTKRCDVE